MIIAIIAGIIGSVIAFFTVAGLILVIWDEGIKTLKTKDCWINLAQFLSTVMFYIAGILLTFIRMCDIMELWTSVLGLKRQNGGWIL